MTELLCPIRAQALIDSSAPALVDPEGSISFGQLDRAIGQMRGFLSSAGIKSGQRVALSLDNSRNSVIVLWATFRLGAVACLLNRRIPAEAVSETIRLVAASALISRDALDPVVDAPKTILVGAAVDKLTFDGADPTDQFGLSSRAGTVLFTSGSTGTAKAVVHRLSAHTRSATGSQHLLPVRKGTTWLLILPLYHAGGLSILFRCFLHGGTVVLPSHRDRLGIDMLRRGVNYISAVPTQLQRVLKAPGIAHIPHPDAVLLGGAAAPDNLIVEATRSGFPLSLTYGGTEMASQVCTTKPSLDPAELRSCGHVLPFRQLQIDSTGEILVRGDTMFDGYLTEQELEKPFDASGWFHTGDVGYLNTHQELVVAGRRDTMFVSGGENVYPEEIEAILLRLPGVVRALVVAVPDDEFGHRPVAFMMGDKNQGTRLAWMETLRRHLPGYKIPDRFLDWPTQEKEPLKPDRAKFAGMARLAMGLD